MIASESLEAANDAAEEAGRQSPLHAHAPRRGPIRWLLALMLLINLAASLYQLPLNRVIERRLCRMYYGYQGGDIDERLCKVDVVQQGLAWTQGVMETAWVVGGEYQALHLHYFVC